MGSGWRRRDADGKEGDWRRTEQKEGKRASPCGWKASDGMRNEEAGREEEEDATYHTPEPPRAR